ncbi:MAG: tetratricopeptide repeat protein [Nitrospirota bacterium]
MGRKFFRTWKHILLCITGITFLLFSGCATYKELLTRHNAQKSLLHSKKLFAEGDFKGSLEENRKVLSVFVKGPPGDEALFNIALIYTHYANPKKDYKISLFHFKMLLNDYPKSSLITQAKIWVNMLDSIQKSRKKIVPEKEIKKEKEEVALKEINRDPKKTNVHLMQSQKLLSEGNFKASIIESRKVLKMQAASDFKDDALFNIALIYAHYNNPEKDYKESIKYFTELMNKYPKSHLADQAGIWLDVLNIIEKAKQVDIDIEKKKKELNK